MESRWLRAFLLLVAIPVLLGITPKSSSAVEPDTIADVAAHNGGKGASLIATQSIGNNGTGISRAKILYSIDITKGTKNNTAGDIATIVNTVAGRMAEIQRADDDGWTRDLDGSGGLLPNTYGLVGMGLLMAHKMNVKLVGSTIQPASVVQDEFLGAALKAGDALIEKAQTDPNTLVSTDVTFLYGLSRVYGGSNYMETCYHSAGYVGLHAFVEHHDPNDVCKIYDTVPADASTELKQLKLWQMASWVEAAKLYAGSGVDVDTTLSTWADSLMAKICNFQDSAGGFYYAQSSGKNLVRTAGQAKVVEVLKRFYAQNNTYKSKLKNGLAYLKGLQYGGTDSTRRGSFYWGGETVGTNLVTWNKVALEDQCYAVQAMAHNFQTRWNKLDNYKGTHWGANYLIKSMMYGPQGGYEFFVDHKDFDPASTDVYVPRVDRNSEAIQALYYSCKQGNITRSGNNTAHNALQVVNAIIGRRKPLGTQQMNGPEIVAADRNNDGKINDADVSILIKDSIGDHEPIRSFLGL
ncbi:MAG: hypothetical protein AB1847_10475 [bacterium]